MLGVLKASTIINQEIKITDIVEEVEKVGNGYTSFKVENTKLPEDIRSILDEAFYGNYQILGNKIVFSFDNIEVSTDITDDLIKQIRIKTNISMESLLQL